MPYPAEDRPEVRDENQMVQVFWRKVGVEKSRPENIEKAISALQIARETIEEEPAAARALTNLLQKLDEILTIAGHRGTVLALRAVVEVLPTSQILKEMQESVPVSRAVYQDLFKNAENLLQALSKKEEDERTIVHN